MGMEVIYGISSIWSVCLSLFDRLLFPQDVSEGLCLSVHLFFMVIGDVYSICGLYRLRWTLCSLFLC